MLLPGKRVSVVRWIRTEPFVVRVEVEAVIPDSDPSEPCLEPAMVRFLDELQRLADAGNIDELAKHGSVYFRRSA
jgi:hypothetical protein